MCLIIAYHDEFLGLAGLAVAAAAELGTIKIDPCGQLIAIACGEVPVHRYGVAG